MSEKADVKTQIADALSDATFEATQRRQIRLGLELTPAQRLQWLEEMLSAHLEVVSPRDVKSRS